MKNSKYIIPFALVVTFATNCKRNKKTEEIKHDTTPYVLETGSFPPNLINPDNRLTIQGVHLGKMLFYEKQMSGDGTLACAGCHMQEFAFTDTARFSTGIQGKKGGRQAMTIFNMAWHGNEFFWDGRAKTLEDQILEPIPNPVEMHQSWDAAIGKLSNEIYYKNEFFRIFISFIYINRNNMGYYIACSFNGYCVSNSYIFSKNFILIMKCGI